MDRTKLCPNPDCTNNQLVRFRQLSFIDGSSNQLQETVFCEDCDTELSADQWERIQNRNTKCWSGVRPRHRTLLHSVSMPGMRDTVGDDQGRGIPGRGGEVLDGQIRDHTIRDDHLHINHQDTRPKQKHQSLSCDDLCQLMSTLPCPQCRRPYVPIHDTKDDNPLAYHCKQCDYCTGFDDTFSELAVQELLEMLIISLEEGTLRTTTCSGGCGNEDVNGFLLDIEDGHVVLKCALCSHTQPIQYDNDSAQNDDVSTQNDDNNESLDEVTTFECDCGNNITDVFAVSYNRNGQPDQIKCLVCDTKVDLDTTESSVEGNIVHPPKGRTEIDQLAQLRPGDHISWHQPLAYWHHAVVVKVSGFCEKVKVIHYNGPAKELGGKGIIMEEWKDIDISKEALYRQDYHDCHSPEVVIQRARSRLGEKTYNLLMNNCEHFAQWCKTGVARSGQVESATTFLGNLGGRLATLGVKDGIKQVIRLVKGVSGAKSVYTHLSKVPALGTVGVGLSATAGGEVARELGQASTSMAKSGFKEVASSLGKVDYMAMGLVLAIEGYRAGRDIHAAYGQMKRGDISKQEFSRVTIKRVTQGVGGGMGTIAGGTLGQILIPIPIVGGFIGATLGALIGEGLGALTGRQLVKAVHGK